MRLSTIVFAILPALALAQEEGEATSTTTLIATTTLTKTYTLSEIHTVIHTPGHNSTATHTPNTSTQIETTSTSEPESEPTTVDEDNAGSALDAGRMLLAGVAGIAVVALL
jgi:carbohydrate-binding DOMON domain-containing protein